MSKNPVFFSIVSPVYQSEPIVPLLVEQIISHVSLITDHFEIILVEDGSRDRSWEAVQQAAIADPRVKAVKLSRNYGQHYAITAGLDYASGDWIVVMDCDLQDKPSEIRHLFAKAQEGYDIVLAQRLQRNDSFRKKLFSRLFYNSLAYLTGIPQDPSVANFGIYSRKVIAALRTMREPIRYFPTMVKWVGFKRTSSEVSHGEREIGTTSYNYRRLFRLAMDIILANSDKPIKLTIKAGLLIAALAFLFGIITIIRYLAGDIIIMGYTSLLISIWFLSGLILTVLGVIGLYLGKTFEGIKNRPIYIVDHTVNVQ